MALRQHRIPAIRCSDSEKASPAPVNVLTSIDEGALVAWSALVVAVTVIDEIARPTDTN